MDLFSIAVIIGGILFVIGGMASASLSSEWVCFIKGESIWELIAKIFFFTLCILAFLFIYSCIVLLFVFFAAAYCSITKQMLIR